MNALYLIVAMLLLVIVLFVVLFIFYAMRVHRVLLDAKGGLKDPEYPSPELKKELDTALLELQQTKSLMNSILDQIPFPIHIKDVNNKSKYVFFNKKTKEEFGDYPLATAQEVLDEDFVKYINKIDAHVYETGETYFAEEEVKYKDGTSYRTLVQKSVIQFDGRRHILIVRWKTEGLLELQEKLKEVNRQNKVILNNINAGLMYITLDFRVQWENISKFKKNHLSEFCKMGELCYTNLYKRDSPCHDCLIKKVMKTKSVQKKELGSLQKNEVLELTAIPIFDQNHDIEAYVMRVDDITEQKRMYHELEEAKMRAEQSDKLKSTFLANMSHEIRTPLNAIVGFSDIMCYADSKEEIEEYNRIISTNGQLLLQLIDDILDLSKIEAGFVELNISKFDLSSLLHELSITLQQRARDGVLVITSLPFESFLVKLDRKRIMQLIMNFASNAVKFTERGSVTLGYEVLNDENSLKTRLKIFVRDTGIGISEENQQKLFKRFEKLDTFAQGTGLGLSIVKSIVALMGGQVGADSKKGEGSTFWAIIPYYSENSGEDMLFLENDLNEIEESDLTVTVSDDLLLEEKLSEISSENLLSENASNKSNSSKKLVLLAEDNESNSFLLLSILRNNYRMLWAKNGREAVELVASQKVDLVLMDLRMPEMDGIQATQRIRMFNKTVPIIAVTAYAFEEDRKRAIDAGCNSFLTKPVQRNELLTELSRFV